MLSKLLNVFSISKQSCEGNSTGVARLGRYSLLYILLNTGRFSAPGATATVTIYDFGLELRRCARRSSESRSTSVSRVKAEVARPAAFGLLVTDSVEKGSGCDAERSVIQSV
ncbi:MULTISPECIES: hypothetical protein [Bradyrhizobium]|uniref:hypothetical protein n=1 Tax=Bradyrhizobium TaxID=374 RepID=UPI001144D79E|nr:MULTISPECIES: hypothetical protein [Bradyrhizobium]UFW45409.1 hypothetical protein BaraCB756_24085 [Bradyrhizobium arachidis]